MKKVLLLWIGTFFIINVIGFLQVSTDPNYPVTGTLSIENKKVTFRFERIVRTDTAHTVIVRSDNHNVDAALHYRVEGTGVTDSIVPMTFQGEMLTASIPPQKPETKISYFVSLKSKTEEKQLPSTGPVTLLFLGKVSTIISVVFLLTLFGGMILAIRTGLEYFNEKPHHKRYSIWTSIAFILNGIVVAPVKISYELGAIGTKVLPVMTVFNPAYLVLPLLWITATVCAFTLPRYSKLVVLITAIVSAVYFVFLH